MLARRNLKVRIIAGVDTGTRIQLQGRAEAGPAGGPHGDLYVEVHVRPHEVFDLDARVWLEMDPLQMAPIE